MSATQDLKPVINRRQKSTEKLQLESKLPMAVSTSAVNNTQIQRNPSIIVVNEDSES